MNRTPRQQLRAVRSFVAGQIQSLTEQAERAAERGDTARVDLCTFALARLRAVERELA